MRHCTTHCRACGAHFTSTRAFDLHRAGSHQANERYCDEPEDLRDEQGKPRLELVTDEGTCRLQDPAVPQLHIRLWAVLGYREVGKQIAASLAKKAHAPGASSW